MRAPLTWPAAGLLLACVQFLASAALACPGVAEPCVLPDGEYDIRLPEIGNGGLVVFLHGAGGRAAAVVEGGSAAAWLQRGYAVVAPQGLARSTGRGPNWGVLDGREHPRDDIAFMGEIIGDATARFDLDRRRVLLAGFSRGGSLVWDIACHRPDMAAAYAPVAGGFWRPHPTACVQPVHLLHTHGFADGTVPLEGRPLRGGAVAQGDIFEGLQLWRQTLGCGARADASAVSDRYWRKSWTTCAGGSLELALHPGGHLVPPGWGELAIDWFESLAPPAG